VFHLAGKAIALKPVMRKKSEHPFKNFPDFFREQDKFAAVMVCSTNAVSLNSTVLDIDNMSEQSLLNLGL
jgi:hypothetical protein